ncbi:MAG TPA: hypothetical protein VHX16_14250 [Chloroflexota bacterium]|jgi:hypothetical protein|nr:hypothetical protein [Chloroflexota bacterium]
MRTYEYREITFLPSATHDLIIEDSGALRRVVPIELGDSARYGRDCRTAALDVLNGLGADGWQLVSMVQEGTRWPFGTHIFAREIS